MLSTLVWYFLVAPVLWVVSTLATGFLLLLALTIAWRVYKTMLVRRWGFLRRRQLKPVDERQAVLITGASSGIGLAVAKHLFKIGYTVIATYYSPNDPGLVELEQLAAADGKAAGDRESRLIMRQLDITKAAQVRQLYDELAELLDARQLRLYALINNAGLGSLQPFAWLQRSSIRNLVETNILGTLEMTREFLPLLAKSKSSGGSRILWVSSGLGFVPGPTYATYGLTKCGQVYFSRCLNLELKQRYGIQSVAVIPHNFIKNTNICSHNVETNKLAWDELKPIERELYGKEYDEHCALTRSLEEATVELAKANDKRLSSGRKASSSSQSLPMQMVGSIVSFLREVNASLNGVNLAATVEESGAPECFEDALRLHDPPEQIFAGDSKFQLLIGSLLLSLPNSCMGLLSTSVTPSLYR